LADGSAKIVQLCTPYKYSYIVLTKNCFFVTLMLLASHHAGAQVANPTMPENYCGTHHFSEWLDWYHDHKQELASMRNDDTTWLYVPVTVHLVAPDNSTAYFSRPNVFRIMCELNEQYAPARIGFYFVPNEPFVYHNKSSWYQHDWDGGADMINSTRIPGRLNCYIVDDPAGNCGYSWYDAIVMSDNCSGPGNSTWAHEAGHHFSLPHPFYGWEGHTWNFTQPAPAEWEGYPVEKMDFSNCYESGDRFCDTRPDYLNYRWGCANDSLSTTVQRDPNGVEFRSDATLYMSYSLDACSSRFTAEQIEAMRTNLYTEHADYLNSEQSPQPLQANYTIQYVSPIDSSIQQYNDVWLDWDPIPGATFYHIEVASSPYFSLVFQSSIVEGGVTTLNITKNLPNNRTLYWRVFAYNEWQLCEPVGQVPSEIFKTKNLSATNELESVADIHLAPNPTSGGNPVVLSVNSSESLDILMTIHDTAGRLCVQQNSTMYAGDNRLEVPTSDMQPGLYFVSIQTKYGTLVKRMVITE
jgi:hypothetical protein